jgi:toxin CptA
LALLALGVLGTLSVLASEMPRAFAIPLTVLSTGWGARLAWREASRRNRTLVIAADGRAMLDGAEVSDLRVQWRGPWAFARFLDAGGRSERLAWWPDTLPARDRRELRLAIPVIEAAQSRPPMAS